MRMTQTEEEVILDINFDDELKCEGDDNPASWLFIHDKVRHAECQECYDANHEQIHLILTEPGSFARCTGCNTRIDLSKVRFIPI